MRRAVLLLLAAMLLPQTVLAALSPEAFTQEFASVMRAALPKYKVQIVEPLQLRITGDQGEDSTAYLENAYNEAAADPDARQDIIERRVAAFAESMEADGAPLDPANIVPIIKDRGWFEEVQAQVKRQGQDLPGQVFEDFNAELVVIYAEDTPKNIHYFSAETLAKAGVERGKLRQLAVANLRRMLPKVELHESPEYFMVTAGGNYEASLLLFDDLWNGGGLEVKGDIVVAIPSRDLLLVTGSRNDKGVAQLREIAAQITAEGNYTITPQLFVYQKGKFRLLEP